MDFTDRYGQVQVTRDPGGAVFARYVGPVFATPDGTLIYDTIEASTALYVYRREIISYWDPGTPRQRERDVVWKRVNGEHEGLIAWAVGEPGDEGNTLFNPEVLEAAAVLFRDDHKET